MTINSVPGQNIQLFVVDIEVDGVIDEAKGIYPNITEIALKNMENQKYFVEYFSQSNYALGDAPYKKELPEGSVRCSFKEGMDRVFSFINRTSSPKTINVLSGFNWWKHDQKVIKFACQRFGVTWPRSLNHSFCFAYLAQCLRFKRGTTQRDLADHYNVKHFTAHRAYNDVRVLSRIAKKMFEGVNYNKIKQAMILPSQQHPVRAVKDVIQKVNKVALPKIQSTGLQLKSIVTDKTIDKIKRVFIGVNFDLETTGLDVEKVRITEFGAKILSPHGINATFQQLVNPKEKIPPIVTKITGITDEMVKDKPTFDQVWPRINKWVLENKATQAILKDNPGAKPTIVWIGYNISGYDIPLLQNEVHRWTGEDYKQKLKTECFAWDFFRFIGTYYNKDYPGPKPPKRKLQVLREFYNLPENQAHRALDDVIITENLMKLHFGKANMMEVITQNLEKPGRYINSKMMILKANGGYPTLTRIKPNSKKRSHDPLDNYDDLSKRVKTGTS